MFMGGFDSMFGFGFGFIFLIVIGMFIFIFVKGIGQWSNNKSSPILTVDANIVAKRADVRHHHHTDGSGVNNHGSSSTSYLVTFQVESGDRMELSVKGNEYGMLAEGDYGKLTFQGTRYLGFQRL